MNNSFLPKFTPRANFDLYLNFGNADFGLHGVYHVTFMDCVIIQHASNFVINVHLPNVSFFSQIFFWMHVMILIGLQHLMNISVYLNALAGLSMSNIPSVFLISGNHVVLMVNLRKCDICRNTRQKVVGIIIYLFIFIILLC